MAQIALGSLRSCYSSFLVVGAGNDKVGNLTAAEEFFGMIKMKAH
jgi:hypothetical protein